MLKMCDKFIVKDRYLVNYKDNTFEVDVFSAKKEGLVIAEVELESKYQAIELPDWIGKEVTGDKCYYNSNLLK